MNLVLYYKPTCPFCQKVLHFMENSGIKGVELKDKSANPVYEQELLNVGGKIQVPCLVIDGKAMYESNDIICWLSENL